MNAVIVGCGRVGAEIASSLDKAGYTVTILDVSTTAFDRLSSAFRGEAIRGDGTDEDILRRAGADKADVFLAMTEGDNRNVMAAELAHEVFGVAKVIAKINDPLRAEAYADLGIATLCRTKLMQNAIHEYLELPVDHLMGVQPPTGEHHVGEHHDLVRDASGTDAGKLPADGAGPGASGPAVAIQEG
jgi:trk system potassium uptake protein TrkA